MRIISDVNSPEAQQLLAAPAFAFDIETDTSNRHWNPNHKRGLSYVADMTEIGFYCGGDWCLILSALSEQIGYAANQFERDEATGELHEVYREYQATGYFFDDAQLAFIEAMFNRDDAVIAVAHNLVFDARQIFGKLGLKVRENYTYWDTRSIYKLRDGWRPASLDEDDEDDTFDEDDDAPERKDKDGAGDLISTYERYVQVLDEGYKAFLNFMKKQRKNFPRIDFTKIDQPTLDYLAAEPTTAPYVDSATAYLTLLDEKREEGSTKKKKEIQGRIDALDISPLTHAMMGHYITFDIVAAYQIFEAQSTPPDDYPKYPKLLEEDLQYQRWCIEAAARGLRVDRTYAVEKLYEVHREYLKQLHDMGMTAADWDRVIKRDFRLQYVFWNNRFDAAYKDQKNYAKNIKEAIALAEKAGEQPSNAYPDTATLSAYQFSLLTNKGQKAFRDNQPISAADFAFGAKAMKDWLGLFPDIPELKNLGRISKLRGAINSLEAILRESEYDGRAHTLLGRFTTTYRNSSTSPNLQNIHFDGTDPGTDMSGIFVSDDERSVLIELDYSNAENYSAAMISADDNMAHACCAEDFHMARARMFFGEHVMDGLTPEERTKKRKEAKTVGFGEGYGMGAKKLAITLKSSVEEAQHLLNLSAQAFPNLADAKDKARAFAEKNGWIPTWSGRRIKIPVRWYGGRKQFSAYTSGWNSPNQGAVAELIVRAINRIRAWLMENNYKTYVSLQVHDSLIINLALDEYPFVVQKIIQIMGSVLDGEIRYKATDERPAVEWNQSTSPAIRWLVDLDNIGNSTKWGRQHNREYPLPITEYVNKWGVHQLTEEELKAKKAPTWINSFGYGEDALKRELAGELGIELDLPEPHSKRDPFHWSKLQHAFTQALPYITAHQINGRVLDFPAAMLMFQTMYERGDDPETFRAFTESLMKLTQVLEEHRQWWS